MAPDNILSLGVTITIFIVLLGIRFHVGLALMLSGLVGISIIRSSGTAMSTISGAPYAVAYNYSLVIIPLFILMGVLAVRAGLAQAGFDLASRLLKRLPGGSALSSLAGSGLFAAVTGSSVATVATMARVSTDAIVESGQKSTLAAGVVCAGGTLGVLIPPSIVLVLYGVVTGESIGRLLLSGIGPGLLTILAYAVTIVILATFHKRKRLIDGNKDTILKVKENSVDIIGCLYLFVIFIVSIGTIYMGIATPTEAASFGALTSLIVFFLRVKVSDISSMLKESLSESIGLTSMTFLLIAGASVFTYFLAISGASSALVQSVTASAIPPYMVLILCLLLLLPLGMFLDGISMILVAAPLLHQILTSYGFDGVWLAILIVKVAEMALITPPVGMNIFVYSGTVKEVGISTAFRGVIPFIIADLFVVAIIIFIPGIATFLPEYSGIN
ncbi:TRAP transporter large permease [Marinomonas foliarum]|uniref:Tripartite ATP-independent transporter DctM subunit n=1 Tax=Marinomonas foliarum TaxID=491950 RepID=A0A368ZRK2_9GAMM|nr:TRAP transporter large permease [Marinomonas foliarum]RCW99644.1 tripartite ATP-independent transporter DctM subunit [Marinomonas foliarum]